MAAPRLRCTVMGMGASSSSLRVVIAGGGVAALETLLALRHHAGDRADVTLVTSDREYVVRAMTVAEPFAMGHADRRPIPAIAQEFGARLVSARLARVDAEDRTAFTDERDELPYDALVVATGAAMKRPLQRALTFGIDDPDHIKGLLLDLEEDYDDAVAFVVPPGPSWPLPVYELALMTAAEVRSRGRSPRVVVITPEPRPLAAFGWEVGQKVAALLETARIELRTDSAAWQNDEGTLAITPSGERFPGFRVVALPVLRGPEIAGLPCTSAGFLPTDEHGRVRGVPRVYAAGDAADWPIKHGGLAAQQADAVAEHIAASAGAAIDPQPFVPVLRGALLTGQRRSYLRAHPAERGAPSAVSSSLLWWPPAKVAARYLAPYLFGEQDEELLDLGPGTSKLAVDMPLQTDLHHAAD